MTKDTTMTEYNAEATVYGIEADSREAAAREFALRFHAGDLLVHVADEDAGDALDEAPGYAVTATPSVAALVALAQAFEASEQAAAECSGGSYGDPDTPAPIDPDAAENYGAATAWGEAAQAVRTILGEGDPARLGGSPSEPFSTHAMVQTAAALLASIAEREGAGSSLADAAEDALALLARGGFAGERSTDAGTLLDLCGRIVEDLADGDYGASAASLMFSAEVHTRHLGMRSLASDLRNSARIVR